MASSGTITSLQNPRVLAARKLLRPSSRKTEGAFLAEGPIVVLEALHSGAEVIEVFVAGSEERSAVAEEARAAGVPLWTVGDGIMDALTETKTPQGVTAVVRRPLTGVESLPEMLELVLILAEVRDPGNAGTLIRSAVAAGADAVVFTTGSVDPFGPKTVRSSAGMLFRVPLVTGVTFEVAADLLRGRGVTVVGADAGAATGHDEVDLSKPLALALGNEAWGLPPEVHAHLDEVVSIRMPGPAESLNVGIAGSILLFEAVRQRAVPPSRPRDGVYPREP
jgi:TrmH family RNA methyltransferase